MRFLYRFLSPRQRLQWYPPFFVMGVRVAFHSDDWREVRLTLPLKRINRNPGGGMFGGAMASLADPLPALMCARFFPDYAVWTRAMTIDFCREARTDVELRLVMDPELEGRIREELEAHQRATPLFEYGFFDAEDRVCAWVHNTVAIRCRGYRPSDGALGIYKR